MMSFSKNGRFFFNLSVLQELYSMSAQEEKLVSYFSGVLLLGVDYGAN